MSYAYRCGVCAEDPVWSLFRHGDAVVSWACDTHLSQVSHDLQRFWEKTEITVALYSATVTVLP